MSVLTIVWFPIPSGQLSCGYWSVVRNTGEGFARLQSASSRPLVHRGSRAMGEALHPWAMGQTCTLKRWYHDVRQRRGSIIAVFSRVARTTSPLQLSHCLKTHLVLWLVECPVPEGNMIENKFTKRIRVCYNCHIISAIRRATFVFTN